MYTIIQRSLKLFQPHFFPYAPLVYMMVSFAGFLLLLLCGLIWCEFWKLFCTLLTFKMRLSLLISPSFCPSGHCYIPAILEEVVELAALIRVGSQKSPG